MTSVKTQSQAVSASSSCRLAYLKLKALANESVSFASESVSLPCELRLFHYAPAKPGCWQWLWYVLHTQHLHREAKWPECPGVLWQWWSRLHCESSSGSGSSVIYSWAWLLPVWKVESPAPKSQVCPGLPSYSCLGQTQVCWGDSWWLSSLLAWHLLLLIWLSLSAVLTWSALKTVFIKFHSQIKQQRSIPRCLWSHSGQSQSSLAYVSKQSWIFVSKLRRLIRQIDRLHGVK